MSAKFDPREAFFLYFIVLGFLVGFFIFGLYLGKAFFVEATQQAELAEELASNSESVEDLSSDLEFYESLSIPIDSGTEESRFGESASGNPENQLLESLPEEPERIRNAPPELEIQSGTGNYTIQVAALSTAAEAEQTRLRLEAKDFGATIVQPGEVPGDRFYRVWVGRYSSIEDAQVAEQKLKGAGFPTFVRKIEQ